MNPIFLSNNFSFYRYQFFRTHYTDNRKGSPMNFIAYMQHGNARIVSKQKTIYIQEGDIFYIPRNLPYQSYWNGNDEISFLSYGFLELEASENINFDLQVISCEPSLKELLKSIPLDGHSPKCKTLSLFYHVFSELLPYMKCVQTPSNKEQVVYAAKKYIAEHPTCSVSEVAKSCYISEPYLYLIFKEKTGYTPNDYRLFTIGRRGIEYLTTTDKTVEEISLLLGLSSASHFRRILKKFFSLTPREIRKNKSF